MWRAEHVSRCFGRTHHFEMDAFKGIFGHLGFIFLLFFQKQSHIKARSSADKQEKQQKTACLVMCNANVAYSLHIYHNIPCIRGLKLSNSLLFGYPTENPIESGIRIEIKVWIFLAWIMTEKTKKTFTFNNERPTGFHF